MSEPDDISPEKHAYWEGRAESEQELSRLRAEVEQVRRDYKYQSDQRVDAFMKLNQERARVRELEEALNNLRIWAADNHVVPTELFADVEYALANSEKENTNG